MIGKIDDLLKECPCKNNGWCFPAKFLSFLGASIRELEQMRLICDERYMDSKKEGRNIENNEATNNFIKNYAKRFAEVYKEGMTNDELFKEVFGFERTPTNESIKYTHPKILDDFLKECPNPDVWCFPKEVISILNKKQLEWSRLVYAYKFMESKRLNRDIGDEVAREEFSKKYKDIFDRIYTDIMNYNDLHKGVFGVNPISTGEEPQADFGKRVP